MFVDRKTSKLYIEMLSDVKDKTGFSNEVKRLYDRKICSKEELKEYKITKEDLSKIWHKYD